MFRSFEVAVGGSRGNRIHCMPMCADLSPRGQLRVGLERVREGRDLVAYPGFRAEGPVWVPSPWGDEAFLAAAAERVGEEG